MPPTFAFRVQGILFVGSWNGSVLEQKAFTYWPIDRRFEANVFDVTIGDVDKDNVTEIITVGYQNTTSPERGFKGQMCIWNLTESNLMLEQSFEWIMGIPSEWYGVSVADVDNDEVVELIVGGYANDTLFNRYNAMLMIFSWNGTNLTWEKSHYWYTFSDTYVNSVATGDIDNDGVIEIITGGYLLDSTRSVNGQLRIWSWDGDGLLLEASREWGSGSIFSYSMVDAIALGDVDSDGVTEIVTGGNAGAFFTSSGQLRIWSWSNAALMLEKTEEWNNASAIKGLAINDIDQDIVPEIIGAGYYSSWLLSPKSELGIWSVSKVGSAITINLSSSSIVIGNQVIISGSVKNETSDSPLSNVEVTIEYSHDPLPVFVTLATVKTNDDGEYAYTWVPSTASVYTIKASWKGDFEHEGASAITSLTVEKASSLIALTLSSYTAKIGDNISVNGILYPAKMASVTIDYTMPNGTIITKTVNSDSTGAFSDTFTANQLEEWAVRASWSGDEQYKDAVSAPITVIVQTVDQTTQILAMAGLGLGLIAIILAALGIYMSMKKKSAVPSPPPTPTIQTPPTP
jgi:hypothetical protein